MVAIVGKHVPSLAKKVGESGEIFRHPPGLLGPVELSVTDPPGWVSDRLLARTIDLWSRAYQRPLTTQEAMEILMNVKRFAELLIRAKEGKKT